jgi:hypothetical protein
VPCTKDNAKLHLPSFEKYIETIIWCRKCFQRLKSSQSPTHAAEVRTYCFILYIVRIHLDSDLSLGDPYLLVRDFRRFALVRCSLMATRRADSPSLAWGHFFKNSPSSELHLLVIPGEIINIQCI